MKVRAHGDDGISLIETVVAMMVFVVFSVVAASYLINTLRVDQSNTQRVVAANLAAQQIELVRGTATLSLPDGASQVTPSPQVAGTTYVVRQQVRFVTGAAGDSVCAGTGSTLAYKLVTVNVSWDGMGSVKPVRADTLRALGLGTNQADVRKGTAAIAVVDAGGQPVSGVTVAVGATSRVTDTDGCAVFPNLDPGTTYTATLSAAGYVGRQGEPSLTTTFSVTAGQVTRTPPLSYAPAGSLAVTLSSPAGYLPPPTLGVTLDSSVLTPTTARSFPECPTAAPQSCVSGTPRTARALFPAVYAAWAGSCADARPTSPPAVAVASGPTPGSVTAALGALQLTLSTTTQSSLAGATLYAYHRLAAGSCNGGESWPMQVASAAERRLALPPGTWDVSRYANGSSPLLTFKVVSAGAVTAVTA